MCYITLVCACLSAFIFESEAIKSFSEELLQHCKATDPLIKQCHIQKYENLRPYVVRGIPELKVPPLDPLYIRRLTVGRRQSSIASYEGQFRNIVFTGLKNYKILDVSVDSDALVYKLKAFLPAIHLTASYYVRGTVLGFELDGEGRFELDITNLVLEYVLDGERYTKDGREHVRWKEGSIEILYDTIYFQAYDLIKDPLELLLFNQALNENAEAMRPTVVSFLDRTIGNYILNGLNLVNEVVPKENLYPTY